MQHRNCMFAVDLMSIFVPQDNRWVNQTPAITPNTNIRSNKKPNLNKFTALLTNKLCLCRCHVGHIQHTYISDFPFLSSCCECSCIVRLSATAHSQLHTKAYFTTFYVGSGEASIRHSSNNISQYFSVCRHPLLPAPESIACMLIWCHSNKIIRNSSFDLLLSILPKSIANDYLLVCKWASEKAASKSNEHEL